MLRSIVFGYLVIVGFVTARIDVTVSKTIYNVQAGDDVTLDCSISSDRGPLDSVFWTKGGKTVFSSSDRDTKKYSGSSIADPSLTIHSTTTSDTGYYYCKGRKGSSTGGSSWIVLRVTEVILPETTYSVLAGTSVTLQCSISPTRIQTTVYWTKAGRSRQVYSSDSPRNRKYYIPGYTDQSLTISDTVIEDTGSYTCQVLLSRGGYSSSPINVTSSPVNLTVYKQFTASIRPHSTDITVPEGNHVTARTCESDDCPPGCVTQWILPNGDRRTSDIFTRPVTREQAGKYTCTASIGDISKSESFSVTVDYGPKEIVLEPTLRTYTMLEGEKMPTVLCTADCNPACHVTWTTNNDRVSGNGTLSLGRLDTSKDGTYTCTARGGTRTRTVTINVTTLYGPKTISLSPPGDVSVQEEERIDVRCQASCSPSCDICWTGPNTYQAGRRGPNLLIRHADRTDRGVYVCVASNDYGNISTSLRVNVNYAGSDIKLVPNDTHYSDKEGTVLPDIRCVAECNPACEMSWYHDRTGRLVEGSTLSLKNMKRSKDGNYMCNATNNLGPQTLSLTVVSLFPPEVLRKDLLNTSYDVDEWDSVFSSISVDASPLPQADLVHVGVDQQEATNVVLQSQRQPVSYRTEFSYSIRNITYSDVGHYTLTVSNSQGDFTYKFSINIIHEGSFGNGGGASHLTAVLVIIVVTVSIAIMLVIVALIFVFRRKQNRERQDKNSGDSDGTLNGEHNVLYGHQEDAPAGLRGFPQQPVDDAEGFIGIHDAEGRPKPVNDVYAEVVRPSSNNRPASAGPSNVYGKGTKPSATDRAKSAGPRDIYSTVSKPTAGKNQELGPETTRTTNKDGLVYLEVDFTKKTDGEETGKVAIHGIENKCDYGEIDFSKKVNLPEDMEN